MKSRSKSSKNKGLQSDRKTSVIDAAEELGVTAETLRVYIREGCPCDKRGIKQFVSVPEVQVWMKATGHTGVKGRPWHVDDSPDLEAARLRKENALAAKYELQTARERRDLMPVFEVKSIGSTICSSFRNAMLGLPPKLAVMLEGRTTAERQDIIESELKHSLDELSRRLSKLGEGNEAA
jgi:hypothetical protein